MTIVIELADEQATVNLGRLVGDQLNEGGVVFLSGTLGAGKTTLTRGILQSKGYFGPVKSPTYTLVEPYELEHQNVYHFDLYRLADPEELEYIGIRDYFSVNHLTIFEWPSRGTGFLPAADIEIELGVHGLGRRAEINAVSDKGRKIINEI